MVWRMLLFFPNSHDIRLVPSSRIKEKEGEGARNEFFLASTSGPGC
jgi:hypothetical protein